MRCRLTAPHRSAVGLHYRTPLYRIFALRLARLHEPLNGFCHWRPVIWEREDRIDILRLVTPQAVYLDQLEVFEKCDCVHNRAPVQPGFPCEQCIVRSKLFISDKSDGVTEDCEVHRCGMWTEHGGPLLAAEPIVQLAKPHRILLLILHGTAPFRDETGRMNEVEV